MPLCPNLEASELAPATAKRGEEKKVRRAASMSETLRWPRVMGIEVGIGDGLVRSVSRPRDVVEGLRGRYLGSLDVSCSSMTPSLGA